MHVHPRASMYVHRVGLNEGCLKMFMHVHPRASMYVHDRSYPLALAPGPWPWPLALGPGPWPMALTPGPGPYLKPPPPPPGGAIHFGAFRIFGGSGVVARRVPI